MLTRCPKCTTTFRVTPEQLKARQGKVRCGECLEVFNALDTLVEAPALVAVKPEMPPIVAPQVDIDVGDAQAAAESLSFESLPTEPEVSILEPALGELPPAATEPVDVGIPDSPADEEPPAIDPEPFATGELNSDTASEEPSPVVVPEVDPTPIVATPPSDEVDSAPALEPLLHEDNPGSRWPWGVGIAASALILAVQAMMHFRTELAVLYPASKPTLAAACSTFGCELLLPRKPELVGIESSDLHPDSDGKLALSATLKNRAPFAQEYPHLELALTDTADRPLVRRVLVPKDYLPAKTPLASGFPANSDLALNLAVETPGIPAVGYRLYLFYP